MSGLEARYYFAINFILYRTVSQRQRDLSFWHLSASVAQTIRDDSLAEKLSVASICFKENDTIHLCWHCCTYLGSIVFSSSAQLYLSHQLHALLLVPFFVPFFSLCPQLAQFSQSRMPKQITIRFERDRYQKQSKWLK